MSKLTDVFSYDDLIRDKLYVLEFGIVASKIAIGPVADKAFKIDDILNDLLALSSDIKVYSKRIEIKGKDIIRFQDYILIDQQLKTIIWLSLLDERLQMELLFDLQNNQSEALANNALKMLQEKYLVKKASKIGLLSRDPHGSFHLEPLEIKTTTVDLASNYNPDFEDIHQIIENSLNEAKSGLILLHGAPGTGKTTYIRHLISTHKAKNFIFIQIEFINHLLNPDFTSFLLQQKDSILIIEDAEKAIMKRDQQKENSVVSTLLQLTDGLVSDFLNIKVICTFNTDTELIDEALLRKGRLIAFYKFDKLSIELSDNLLRSLGHEPQNREMTLTDIFNFEDRSFKQFEKNGIGFKQPPNKTHEQ